MSNKHFSSSGRLWWLSAVAASAPLGAVGGHLTPIAKIRLDSPVRYFVQHLAISNVQSQGLALRFVIEPSAGARRFVFACCHTSAPLL
jgi:hypothetical protein